MTNVTYLLGAGASAKAIPMVNSFSYNGQSYLGLGDSIGKYAIELKDKLKGQTTYGANNSVYLKTLQFCSDLENLYNKSTEYGSIDTYAKKLFLLEEFNELNSLKLALSLYFSIIQETTPVDYRYNSFLSKILKKTSSGIKLPDEIQILSWNYDIQLEIALKLFATKESDKSAFDFDVFCSKIKSAPIYQGTRPQIIHLNGVAGSLIKSSDHDFITLHGAHKINNNNWLFEFIEKTYLEIQDNNLKVNNALNFSWEDDTHNLLEKAIDATKNTDILVIIGYSFPYLNREIDKQIIQAMAGTKEFKLYYQDPISDGSHLKSHLSLDKNVAIHWEDRTTQFFTPPEL